MMIHLKFLIFLLLFAGYTYGSLCKLEGQICTFSGVNTSESSLNFNPFASDNKTVDVEWINFDKSKMHTFTEEPCKVFPNLHILKAENLAMEYIASNSLYECKNLIQVFFAHNKLEMVDNNLFKENLNLSIIDFQNNNLKSIDGRMFEPVKQLSSLSLSENFLTQLPLGQFPTLKKMFQLHIHTNDLTNLDEQVLLQKFPNLTIILMHNNLFECGRLRIIIDTLNKSGIKLGESRKHLRTHNTYLTTIDNVECVIKGQLSVTFIVGIGILLVLLNILPVIVYVIWKHLL